MAVTDVTPNGPGGVDDGAPKVALLNNPEIRGWLFQIVLAVVVAYLAYSGWKNMNANLHAAGIASGWAFLGNNAGFAISQSLIEYNQASSTYGRVYLVGLINTLVVAVIGIILATIIGFLIGVARLSKNWIVSRLAAVYVESLRNIPLLLQIFHLVFRRAAAAPATARRFRFRLSRPSEQSRLFRAETDLGRWRDLHALRLHRGLRHRMGHRPLGEGAPDGDRVRFSRHSGSGSQ